MRSALVALAGTAILVLSLSGCADQSEPPAAKQPEAPPAGQSAVPGDSATERPAGQSGAAGSATDELAKISSSLDAIDSELASDGSP